MMYEGIVIPTVLYGVETWGLREVERKKLEVFLRWGISGVRGFTLRNTVRNEGVRRAQVERQLSDKVDQCVLRWFGQVERMDE